MTPTRRSRRRFSSFRSTAFRRLCPFLSKPERLIRTIGAPARAWVSHTLCWGNMTRRSTH
jgi:hypothetical protein